MSDKKEEQKEEEKPSEGTGKEEHQGGTTWICPGCGTRYTGWSTLNDAPNVVMKRRLGRLKD